MKLRRSALVRAALACAVLTTAACRGGGDGAAKVPRGDTAEQAFDWNTPRAALDLDAGEAARRIGSFEWTARVSWRVHRGDGTRSSAASEEHRVRQLASGAFAAEASVDDGRSDGSETGRHVVYVNGMTYAKGRWGPWRERPTDRGRDAQRFRDESFRLAGDLAFLCGPSLRLTERGTATVEGRPVRRFVLGLDPAAPAAQRPAAPAGRSDDRDTSMRLELLEGAVPRALEGELFADAATGVPLRVRMRGVFGVPSDASLRAEVELEAGMSALGGAVAAVQAPPRALPDERKPKGVAQALEAAGLKKAATPEAPGGGERAEPTEE